MSELITEQELFSKTGTSYSCLIHLENIGSEDTIASILSCEPLVSDQLIHDLISAGNSWRERLVGLTLACKRDVNCFADSMFLSLHDARGISIIPTFAVLSIAVRYFSNGYSLKQTETLDRSKFDGELGYALDCFHSYIGRSTKPIAGSGPNYGQQFLDHVEFYKQLCNV